MGVWLHPGSPLTRHWYSSTLLYIRMFNYMPVFVCSVQKSKLIQEELIKQCMLTTVQPSLVDTPEIRTSTVNATLHVVADRSHIY